MKKIIVSLLALISMTATAQKNPILPEMHADPEVLADGGRYYIYSTTDGATVLPAGAATISPATRRRT